VRCTAECRDDSSCCAAVSVVYCSAFDEVKIMAAAAPYDVIFDVEYIDNFYVNAAIYHMNQRTERAMWELSKHISDLYTFIDNVTSLMSTYQPKDLIAFMSTAPKMDAWPAVPQILPVDERDTGKQVQRKAAKHDDLELIGEMRRSVKGDVTIPIASESIPSPMSQQTYDLMNLQKEIEDGARKLDRMENFQLNNIFNYGQWLLLARESFRAAKDKNELLSTNFIDWLDVRCNLKKTRAYDYMKFTERFSMFPGILKCQLPFYWFKTNGGRICNYLQANAEDGRKWQT